MMRQAGRYQQAYRDLALKHPSFRERSEVTDLIVEISMQPWKSFKPDGVILFSDILTPLSACGIPFEIDDNKGPLIDCPINDSSGLKGLHDIELEKLSFVGESLRILRQEVEPHGAAVLGFVGSPWTLATYVVEGKSTNIYKVIKTLMFTDPATLNGILNHLTKSITEYCRYQVDSGASYLQVWHLCSSQYCHLGIPCMCTVFLVTSCLVQLFDSWGGQLPPHLWDTWSRPYIEKIIAGLRETHASTPIMLYANGSGGLLERMGGTGADVIGLDWTIDMADARKRLGSDQVVQGNLDPSVLFADKDTITDAVHDVLTKAGTHGHILNLGHGVLVGTPEDNVKHVFDLSKQAFYCS